MSIASKAPVQVVVMCDKDNVNNPGMKLLAVYPGDPHTTAELRSGKSFQEMDCRPLWWVELSAKDSERVGKGLLGQVERMGALH